MLGLGTSINKSSSSESASIAGRSSSFTGLLDESYGGSASAAYSVRRLSGSYSGKALQIRRVSDNVEVDVSFDNNNEISLDSAVTNVTEETTGSSTSIITGAVNLGEFVANASYTDADSLGSTDSAKVQCWYDQSGNSNDTTQNTAGNQPTIVSSGALVTENGKPALEFDGSDDNLAAASAVVTGAELFCSNVLTMGTTGQPWGDQTGFGVRAYQAGSSVLRVQYNTDNGGFQMTGDNSGSGQRLKSTRLISGTQQIFDNGSLATSATRTFTSLASNNVMRFGMRYNNTNFFNGKLQEYVIYTSDQYSNRTNIENNINAFYSIF